VADEGVEVHGDDQGVFQVIDLLDALALVGAVDDVPLPHGNRNIAADAPVEPDAPDHALDAGQALLDRLRDGHERGEVVRPVVEVPVDIQVIQQVAPLLQQQPDALQDVAFPVGDAGGHQPDLRVDPLHHLAELGEGAGVFLRRLVADLPVAVHLIADAPVADVMRRGVAVRPAQAGDSRVGGPVAVLDPVPRLAHVAVAAVDDQERLRPHQTAELDELVCAEAVGLDVVPGQVQPRRALRDGADPVAPVVAGGEVAAGVADQGHPQPAQGGDHVRAQAPRVGQRRVRVVDAPVDAAGHVLREPAEDVAVDPAQRVFQIHVNPVVHRLPSRRTWLTVCYTRRAKPARGSGGRTGPRQAMTQGVADHCAAAGLTLNPARRSVAFFSPLHFVARGETARRRPVRTLPGGDTIGACDKSATRPTPARILEERRR